MIRRLLVAAGAAVLPVISLRVLFGRWTERLLAGVRAAPEEAALGPALDALGGEVVRVLARDGVRLSARWLPRDAADELDGWAADPREAILLLHGYSGSVAPDLVEYGPFLRRTAGVLGLDFRGHGDSEDGPTTFGLREVEDVAGALAWLGGRGIRSVCLVGTSMGGITALAAVVLLGDGSLAAADAEPDAPAAAVAPPRPRIAGVVADSVAPELPIVVANRLRLPIRPVRHWIAGRLFAEAARRLGGDPRATEPIRIGPLVEPVPLLLIHGDADTTVPLADGRRLAAAAGPSADHWVIAGAGHSAGHSTSPAAYEARVTEFLRAAFLGARESVGILGPAGAPFPPEASVSGSGRVENH